MVDKLVVHLWRLLVVDSVSRGILALLCECT